MRDVPLHASQKDASEQPEGRRAVGTAQGSQQGTELTEWHLVFRNVSAAYQPEWRRVSKIATTPKSALSVQGEGVSNDHESAQQPEGR